MIRSGSLAPHNITVLMGHRGTGKTGFLRRLKSYYDQIKNSCIVIDLDEKIVQFENQSIEDIFAEGGEEKFRKIEEQTFARILEEVSTETRPVFIALGAGYSGSLPEYLRVWWIRRPTDSQGRIFLNRPRLSQKLSPFEDYMTRFEDRDARYREMYHRQIIISEGWDFENGIETYLLGMRPAKIDASVTVLPIHFSSALRLKFFLEDLICLGVKYFELRDDLLSLDQIQKTISLVPHDKILISFRRSNTDPELLKLSGPYATDWAVELGPCPLDHISIASLHDRLGDESIDEATERLLAFKADHYKLAPKTENFLEIWTGHRFWSDDPERRSFLPRSQDGRWGWYRQLLKGRMKHNFVRVDDGSSFDQPTLFEYLRIPKNLKNFAAVLGDPVTHSRSPAEHDYFFHERESCMLSVRMQESECNSLNLSILERLGMVACAVTSPLKIKAHELCKITENEAARVKALNTLLLTKKEGWIGTNTDITGLQEVFKALPVTAETAVWGGGGTRWALRSILKTAKFFSARRGEEIWIEKGSNKKEFTPDVLVWALGRSRWDEKCNPPEHWRPQYVFDLNYTEDSPGLEWALKKGARYISGYGMFKAQAAAQRRYWERELGL